MEMITFQIDTRQAHTHRFHITLIIAEPQAQQRVSLPVWIPGSYLVREFAKQLSDLEAFQNGQSCTVQQLDKTTWQVDSQRGYPLVLRYKVYGFDLSVRTAYLSQERGFFNGTSLCLAVAGQEHVPHQLQLSPTFAPSTGEIWKVATGLEQVASTSLDSDSVMCFQAQDYDDLVDHPVEMGAFWQGHFFAHGVPHELIISGHLLPDTDTERLLQDTQRICEAQIDFWHANKQAPFKRYVFLLHVVEDGYGGLEHRNSTALIASRRDLPRKGMTDLSDSYVTLLGLISHEYFHTWNVKRLRPADLAPLDYSRENHTRLLWFFEGFTSYYDDLFLLRSQLIDATRYLQLLSKTINAVLFTPGRKVQSAAQASFDAWTKYYRPDENTPNLTVNYYTKGALIALALDLTLRQQGNTSLDKVMHTLWLRSGGGSIREKDIFQVVDDLAEAPFSLQLRQWVHDKEELPIKALLEAMGINWLTAEASMAQRLGLKVTENPLTGIKITHVLDHGCAQASGLCAGDEWLGLNGWRLRRLEDLQRLVTQPNLIATIAREQRLVQIPLVSVPEVGQITGNVKLDWVVSAKNSVPKSVQQLRQQWLQTL
jgi:predicted metalloprotease with PDZ domain